MNVQNMSDSELSEAIRNAKSHLGEEVTFEQYGALLRERNTRSGYALNEKQIMSRDVGSMLWDKGIGLKDIRAYLIKHKIQDIHIDHVKQGWKNSQDAWDEHQREKAH